MFIIAVIVGFIAIPYTIQKFWDLYRIKFVCPKLYANAVPILPVYESVANGTTDRIDF